MRQTPIERWMEAAEARRIDQMERVLAVPLASPPASLVARLQSRVLPWLLQHRRSACEAAAHPPA